ncbi:MAG: hypothetical protein J5I93_20830 [Pirellulaceae bacterium]|nr:hypothetical protein [Pirellulaceae bacterium]
MPATRTFALVQSEDQWGRCAHENTALLPDGVRLRFRDEVPPVEPPLEELRVRELPSGSGVVPAGLAFDPWRRLYRTLPERGQVERLAWAADESAVAEREPLQLFATDPIPAGDFQPAESPATPLRQPQSVAVDRNGRLYVAETGAGRILVYDLFDRRLLRVVPTLPARPLDLACAGGRVLALLDQAPFIVWLDARRGPFPLDLGDVDLAALGRPARLATWPDRQGDELLLLVDAGTVESRVVPLARPTDPIGVPLASDLELVPGRRPAEGTQILVVARGPGQSFARLALAENLVARLSSLRARGYDGRGLVRSPDDRIGYWSALGFRHAAVDRARYATQGRVTTFQLDSGQFQTRWGRVLLDACVPQGTDVRIWCHATDELGDGPRWPRTPPVVEQLDLPRPDLSPPMPPADWLRDPGPPQQLYRRTTGSELPWISPQEDELTTFEGPADAPPGRYLWVSLELLGNGRSTPRVSGLRVEYPAHDLLRRLPAVLSRDPVAGDFLQRYLGMFASVLSDLDAAASHRHLLIDPRACPNEMLAWLASLLGFPLDDRWSAASQRLALSQVMELYRRRGTVAGLRRLLGIYLRPDLAAEPDLLDASCTILENFRLRGNSHARLTAAGDPRQGVVVGSFQVAGDPLPQPGAATVGVVSAGAGPAGGAPSATGAEGDRAATDAFARHAHRFSLIIPRSLSPEQLAVVRQILEVHRPAHTLYEICTVDSGLRIGRGAYLEVTTLIGRGGEFGQARVGQTVLGAGSAIGRRRAGIDVGSGRLGQDTRSN